MGSSRRSLVAIGAGSAGPLAGVTIGASRAPAGPSPDAEAAALVQRAGDANAAFMRGDMDRWLALSPLAEDFTLMAPFGGAPSHGFDTSAERLARMSAYFRNGRTALELVQAYASAEMVVLAVVERQRGEVGGLPEQDWSLRVTLAYRRDGSGWRLVHRHADPLVRGIALERAAALARGEKAS